MIKSYLLVAWRNLWRKKSFSFLNIAGLSIGMAAAILIALWIQSEFQRDEFHQNKDRIFEVWNRYEKKGGLGSWDNTPKIMASAIQRDFPEVEHVVRVNYSYQALFSIGDKRINARGNFVDSSFLRMFTFPLIKGNPATALNDMHSVVITEGLGKSLFGDEDPMGKIVKLDNQENFTVTGIVKDLPSNSRFDFQYLAPWSFLRHMGDDDDNWSNNSTMTYVMLKENASLDALNSKILHLRKTYDKADPEMETFLYPFTRSYLYGTFENGKEAGGRIEIVRLFGIIAAFILLVACINFMNLSTARSEKRAREVGIRKVVGAGRKSLIFQFLGESILLATLAAVIALLIVQLALPAYSRLVEKELSLDPGNWQFWGWGIAFIFVTGLLAGSYPAIYLSSFRPVSVMKGTFKAANALITPRKILVVGQFTFAIVLIIATLVVRLQMKNAQDRQTGYSKENLIYSYMEGDIQKNYTSIKNEILASGAATSVTKTMSPITEIYSNTWGIGWQGKDPNDRRIINRFSGDENLVKTFGMQLVDGRDIDLAKYPTDSNAVLLNEAAVKMIGFKDPVGQVIQDLGQDFHVVGVVKDFIVTSPYQAIEPLVILGEDGFFNVVHIKLNKQRPASANIATIEKIFKKFNPEYPYQYSFADAVYAKKFDNEQRTGTLASLFAALTIIISCLGLFGLASYMAENRIKEIGVRKVLGASVSTITRLLSIDFLKLVAIAFLIATPLGYMAMNNWLKDFPYRVDIPWWIFAIAGVGSLLIALLTVSFQAIRAARTNPVTSLRSE